MTKYPKKFQIYRANKSGNGCALSVDMAKDDNDQVSIWLNIVRQGENNSKGNATFDWQNNETAIRAKLGETDIGEFIAVLEGRKGGLGMADGAKFKGLFHSTDNGSTSIRFDASPPEKELVYYFGMTKKSSSGELKKGDLVIGVGEAARLNVLLRDVISLIYNWREVPELAKV